VNHKLLVSIRIALRALLVNKLRSALTMLGIVIGVSAVITMVAMGAGATESIKQQVSSFGSNMLVVVPGSVNDRGAQLGLGRAVSLTEADARAIAAECPAIAYASPVAQGGAHIVFGNNNWSTSIQGVTPDFLHIRDMTVQWGDAISAQDVDAASKVVILGRTVAENLFGDGYPVGQTVRIGRVPFTVVGVLRSKGQSNMGQDQDDVVLMPISTAKKRVLGSNEANAEAVGQIMVQARHITQMTRAEDEIRELLRQRHNIQPEKEDDFQIRNLEEFFSAMKNAVLVMAVLLASIASISLLVGGIGIMNTMLISVAERTREIGLRQAVGAKVRDIKFQFLVESAVLSAIGGGIGIALGILAATIISHFAPFRAIVSPVVVMIAFVFSAMVGVFFGYYPARKAALLDPIEALRYE
jgi:putative ABC transport system permease protein